MVAHSRSTDATTTTPQVAPPNWVAGTPAAPTISSVRGGVSAASIAFSTSPTATSYNIQPTRNGTNAAATAVVKTTGGPHDIPLERGAWKLLVTAINAAGVASPPATSDAVVIGTPLAATGVAVEAGPGQANLTFGCEPQAALQSPGCRPSRAGQTGCQSPRHPTLSPPASPALQRTRSERGAWCDVSGNLLQSRHHV